MSNIEFGRTVTFLGHPNLHRVVEISITFHYEPYISTNKNINIQHQNMGTAAYPIFGKARFLGHKTVIVFEYISS